MTKASKLTFPINLSYKPVKYGETMRCGGSGEDATM